MVIRLNNNSTAMNAYLNVNKNHNKLVDSIERLSSGFRINRAADDSAGLITADSLRSQALSLGQAISNTNDGINITQIADSALEESINIINLIKTKAIQAAQDSQTVTTRSAIQSDVNKLLEELDIIATTTTFNDQKLLMGNFSNKAFQIGANRGETANLSIPSAQTGKLGHVKRADLSIAGNVAGEVSLSIFSPLLNTDVAIQSVELKYDNTAEGGLGTLAAGINRFSDSLGITATPFVSSTTGMNIAAGTTDSDFAVNGITIGAVDVKQNDGDGSLVAAINGKTSEHGVTASVDIAGLLTLTTADHRAVKVSHGSALGSDLGTDRVFRGTDMSTFGHLQINQEGPSAMVVRDIGGGAAVALESDLAISGNSANTTLTTELTSGSVLTEDSVLGAGWSTGQSLTGDIFLGSTIHTSLSSSLKAGSVLITGSILGTDSDIGGSVQISEVNLTANDSIITDGSVLKTGTEIAGGTTLGGDVTVSGPTSFTSSDSLIKQGSILGSGTVIAASTVLGGQVKISGTAGTTNADSSIAAGSILGSGSIITAGSVLGGSITLNTATGNTAGNSTVKAGSTLQTLTEIAAGTVFGGGVITSGLSSSTSSDSNILVGSTLQSGSTIGAGSTLGGNFDVGDTLTTATPTDSTVKAGSILISGSIIGASTSLGANITMKQQSSGTLVGTGVLLDNSTIGSGSILKAGTIIFPGQTISVGAATFSGTLIADLTVTSGAALNDGGISLVATGSKIISTTGLPALFTTGSKVAFDFTIDSDTGTTDDMTAKAGTRVASGTTLAAGSSLASQFTLLGPGVVGSDMILKSGSRFADATVLSTGSDAGTKIVLANNMTTTSDMTMTSGSRVTADSVLATGSSLGAHITVKGSGVIDNDMTLLTGATLADDTILERDSSLAAKIILDRAAPMSLIQDMTLKTGSIVGAGSLLKKGSSVAAKLVPTHDLILEQQMTLKSGSKIADNSTLKSGSRIGSKVTTETDMTLDSDAVVSSGSTLNISGNMKISAVSSVGGDATLDEDLALTGGFTLGKGSMLADGSILANGSTIGATITIADDETVSAGSEMLLGAGSVLKTGSTITEGTYLTNTITSSEGETFKAGTLLTEDIVVSGDQAISSEMTLQPGSILKAGSFLGVNISPDTAAGTTLGDTRMRRLSDLNVMTREDANSSIAVAQAALKDLGKIRSGLGSFRNQLSSNLAVTTSTKVNVSASESAVRDIDFAEETTNFAKLQILSQAGTFALTQANALAERVLSLIEQ